jgi:3-dehydrosphinganine reductase
MNNIQSKMTKTALITGGSSGLGFTLAEQLGKNGYRVIILARNAEKINRAVIQLKGMNIDARGISCDTVDESELKKTFELVKSEYGRIDFLILNAGVVTTRLLSEYPDTASLKQDVEIDLWGTILSTWQFLPLLDKGSKILMISSGFGLMGAAGYSMYCAAKAGIVNFAESLRRELLSRDINVYVACPGDMDTPQFHEEMKSSPAWMKKETPRKLMSTGIVAARILKQCSGKSKFLIIPASDVKLLVFVSKIVPRRFRDFLLDKLFPQPGK